MLGDAGQRTPWARSWRSSATLSWALNRPVTALSHPVYDGVGVDDDVTDAVARSSMNGATVSCSASRGGRCQ